MEKLEKNFRNYLPLNRKERFYTGTVLPGIICYENFRYINLFLKLVTGFPQNLSINPDAEHNNIQFLTEYSLKESGNFTGRKFDSIPETKDTPDLMILVTEPDLYLIVLEAKMYSSPNIADFKLQIQAQKRIIHCIQSNLGLKDNHIFQLGLIPKGFMHAGFDAGCPLIFWEDIVIAYQHIMKGNYFFETLKLALSWKKEMMSPGLGIRSYGKNAEDRLTGTEIMNRHRNGLFFWIGRKGGLNGNDFSRDLETGGWKTVPYEVNFSKKPLNRNWFSLKEFADAVKSRREQPEISTEITDPWHFSFLGREYYEKISMLLGYGGSLDCPVQSVYTGKTGVEYKMKLLNRKVNPNWFVTLQNGKQLKCDGTGKPMEGSYSSSGYIRTRWELIRNYNW